MTATLDGAPRLQRNWDSRAACNFIGGGAGTGLLLAAAAALPAGWPYFSAGALGVALIGFGLSMVWLEIGRPFRALNVFFHPQTSWMSREALLALPLLTLAGIATVADQSFVPLPPQMRLLVTPLALAAAALGLAFLYCQARILRASHGVPAWRELEVCNGSLLSLGSRRASVCCSSLASLLRHYPPGRSRLASQA